MPLLQEQLAALRHDVELHERRLDDLREVIRRAEEEAAFHEALVALAGNERLLAAAGEYCDDPGLASAFATDPAGRFRHEGIRLPEGVTVNSAEGEASSGRLTAQLRCGPWNAQIGWEHDRGFFAIPDTRRLRQLTAVVNFVDTTPVDDESQADKPPSSTRPHGV